MEKTQEKTKMTIKMSEETVKQILAEDSGAAEANPLLPKSNIEF